MARQELHHSSTSQPGGDGVKDQELKEFYLGNPLATRDILARERESVSVSEDQVSRFTSRLTRQREELARLEPYMLHRRAREGVHAIMGLLDAIVRNCSQDHRDIEFEFMLPSLMERTTTALKAYIEFSARDTGETRSEEVLETEEMFVRAPRALEALLEQMQSNDGVSLLARARNLSRVFDTPPIADQTKGKP